MLELLPSFENHPPRKIKDKKKEDETKTKMMKWIQLRHAATCSITVFFYILSQSFTAHLNCL